MTGNLLPTFLSDAFFLVCTMIKSILLLVIIYAASAAAFTASQPNLAVSRQSTSLSMIFGAFGQQKDDGKPGDYVCKVCMITAWSWCVLWAAVYQIALTSRYLCRSRIADMSLLRGKRCMHNNDLIGSIYRWADEQSHIFSNILSLVWTADQKLGLNFQRRLVVCIYFAFEG